MNLKIDTRERFDIITLPAGNFDSALAAELTKCMQSCRENGRSAILCMDTISSDDGASLQVLEQLHEEMYADNFSFVLCGMNESLKKSIQELEYADALNLTPTLAEAIDIVSMEEVERELLGGE